MTTNNQERERWTDEKLDKFADSVALDHEQFRQELAELREGIAETKDSVDGLRITAQALLQLAAQHQQEDRERQEQMRLINERLDVQQGQIKVLLEKLLGT